MISTPRCLALVRACAHVLLALVLLPSTASAQRGGGGGGGPQTAQPVGAPRFEYVGPTNAGRIAAAAAVAGKPGVYCDDKWYVEKYKLYLNLVSLLGEVGGSGGDVMGGVGFRPTNASLSVFKDRLAELELARKDFDRLVQDVAAFNKAHAGRVPAISDAKVPSKP